MLSSTERRNLLSYMIYRRFTYWTQRQSNTLPGTRRVSTKSTGGAPSSRRLLNMQLLTKEHIQSAQPLYYRPAQTQTL